MKIQLIRALMAVAASLAVSACLPIPHRHTQRAGARFHVTDQSGHAIPAATVNVYQGSIIGGTLERVATVRTDSAGFATIAREQSLHLIMIFVPDAEAPSVFGWCVQSPGYASLGRPMEDERNQTLEAQLLPSTASASCPERLDRDKLEHGRFAKPAA